MTPGLLPPMFTDSLNVSAEDYSLLTDLYQLTMSACYLGEGLDQRRASFELTVRRLPEGMSYLIAMGLAQVVDYLQNFQFTPDQIKYLQQTGIFTHAPDTFWALLAEGRFTGDLWAVPEGTVVFPNEPLLRVEAPLWQAQLAETYLLNTINYQTLVATRAARLRELVGPEVKLLEFGTRRAFSPQGAVWAARAALAAGFDATSNVLAAARLGRKPAGTMAHALVMAIAAEAGSEAEAFLAFSRHFPGASLLIDTYDPPAAAQRLKDLQAAGQLEVSGVRIDSGDLAALSRQVREILPGVAIMASGDVDEAVIRELQAQGACIDGFGIGTKLVTGHPVNGVYKLVEIEDIPVLKASTGKTTYPGRKQIYRHWQGTEMQSDTLGLMAETLPEITPLLQPVLKRGELIQPSETLETIAQRTATSLASLPLAVRRGDQPLPVNLSPALQDLTEQTRHRFLP